MKPRAVQAGCVLLAVWGCSGGSGDVDAAGADANGDASATATPADIPWLGAGVPPIAIAPCPDGWRELDEDGVVTCEPYPDGALDCPVGEAHFPGELACTQVGSPCPAGEFAGDLPTDVLVVYIRPGAMGGDGSASMPYGTLTEFSLGALPMGTAIALSVGTHVGPLGVARRHQLVGACSEATVLRATVPDATEAVVRFAGVGGVVRDLTLADSPRPGARVDPSSEGRLEGVIVERTQAVGVFVAFGASLTAQTAVVRDTAEGAGFGRGLAVQAGGTAELSHAVLARNHDVAMISGGIGSTLTLTDAVVRDTMHSSDGAGGRGMAIQTGATADVSATALSGNHDVGVIVAGADTALTLSDALVRDTGEDAFGFGGQGVAVQDGAGAVVSRVLVSGNREVGVFVYEASALTLSDAVVRDTREQARDGLFGRGIEVHLGGTGDARRVSLSRNSDAAVAVIDAGTSLTLTDALLQDTAGRTIDGFFGRGLVVQDAAVADMSRVLLSRNRELGVSAFAGAELSLADVVISNSLPRACADGGCPDTPGGHGLGTYQPATAVRMTRFSVRDSALCGLQLAEEAALDLDDGEVIGNEIGACVQVDGYDIDRLMSGVRFASNGTNLDATRLPVPDAAQSLMP